MYMKDKNYYIRLKLIHHINKFVRDTYIANEPVPFNPPVVFTYVGGKQVLINMELSKYMSRFKREFSVVRCQLDNGSYVNLDTLRNKHLLEIQKRIQK